MAPEFMRRGAPGSDEAAAVADFARVLTWPEDEAGLMTELRSGSQPAFDWLVTHYHRPVFGLVAGMLYDRSEAADVTQEVFLRAFRGIAGFRQGSSLKTWLYRIAVRQALNHRRWSWRHLRQQSSMDAEPGENGRVAQFEAPGASPFDELASREVQQAVRQALGRVAEGFRTAVILRDLEGLSYEEIAEVMDCPIGTVRSRIFRAREAIDVVLKPLIE